MELKDLLNMSQAQLEPGRSRGESLAIGILQCDFLLDQASELPASGTGWGRGPNHSDCSISRGFSHATQVLNYLPF